MCYIGFDISGAQPCMRKSTQQSRLRGCATQLCRSGIQADITDRSEVGSTKQTLFVFKTGEISPNLF